MDNLTYEFFICRSWKCERFKKGANTDTWERLLIDNINYKESIGTSQEKQKELVFNKQLVKVKDYIDKAYINLIKRVSKLKNSATLIDQLIDYKNLVTNSNDPTDIYDIMKNTISFMNNNNL